MMKTYEKVSKERGSPFFFHLFQALQISRLPNFMQVSS